MNKIDYRGLKCPMPVLKAHKIIKNDKKNTIFEFICDDKSAPKDFEDLCNNSNYKLISIKRNGSLFFITISKSNSEK